MTEVPMLDKGCDLSRSDANPHRRRWIARATTAIVVAGSLAAFTADVSVAQAVPTKAKKVQVVKVVTRPHFGKMLSVKKSKLSLYYKAKGTCGSLCQSAWPPLLMAKGSKASPSGVACLGVAKFGKRSQVTYRGHRLYTFVDDTGTMVTGNGLEGFKVAKVTTGKCPKPKK